ncbi:hypothetical protein GLOTRDRAFT_98052, partial [Gloeophyllum trabeum ATCC 11539]
MDERVMGQAGATCTWSGVLSRILKCQKIQQMRLNFAATFHVSFRRILTPFKSYRATLFIR